MKKFLFFSFALLVAIAVIFFFLWTSIFPIVYHVHNLALHFQPKDAADTSELVLASRKLQSSIVFDSSKSYNVYICPSEEYFNALAPMNQGSNARVYKSINVIFIRPLINQKRNDYESPQRSTTIAGLIASTITMIGLQDDSLTAGAEKWKRTGYAEYIGNDSLQNTVSLCKYLKIEEDQKPLLESIKDQFIVMYLMREKGIGFDSLLSIPIRRDSILQTICASSMSFHMPKD